VWRTAIIVIAVRHTLKSPAGSACTLLDFPDFCHNILVDFQSTVNLNAPHYAIMLNQKVWRAAIQFSTPAAT